MKIECPVIKDLLPLYAEGMTSPETDCLVQTHLEVCASCGAEYKKLKTGRETLLEPLPCGDEAAGLKRVKAGLHRKSAAAVICAVMAVLILALGFTTWMYRSGRIGLTADEIMLRTDGQPVINSASIGLLREDLPIAAKLTYSPGVHAGYYSIYIRKTGLNIGWSTILQGVIEPGDGIIQIDVEGYGKAYLSLNEENCLGRIERDGEEYYDFRENFSDVFVEVTDGAELAFYDIYENRLEPNLYSCRVKG